MKEKRHGCNQIFISIEITGRSDCARGYGSRMRTEDLTAILAASLEPVDSRRTMRRYVLGISAGALVALLLTGGGLHLNPALPHEVSEPSFWVRELYCASLSALAVLALAPLA